jgi:hypothetical protein
MSIQLLFSALLFCGCWMISEGDLHSGLMGCAAGFVVGSIASTLRTLYRANRLWQVYEQVIDWSKVEAMTQDQSG